MNAEITHILAEAFRDTPFEGRVYQVGGSVRDELLGLSPDSDLDFVVEGDGILAAEVLVAKGVAESSTQVFENFGTAMVVHGGMNLEFVGARRESYRGESRKPAVQPASLLEDSQRRDFTVNALLRRLDDGEVIDLLGTGREDLEARVLRTPLDPDATFSDDPLRILRGIRFRGQLNFSYADGLEAAMARQAERLRMISVERIQGELVKMLRLPAAAACFADLQRLGVLHQFWPEFDTCVGVEQGKYHHLDVWHHTLKVLSNVEAGDLILSLAALFHDVGKPSTRFVDEKGDVRFFGHETVGADLAKSMMSRLRFPIEDGQRVARLVKNHMRLGSAPELSASATRRLIRDMEEDLPLLLDLVEADANGLKAGVRVMDLAPIRAQIARIGAVTPANTLVSPLDGKDLMEMFQRGSGTWIRELKQYLQDAVIEGHLEAGDREKARDFAVEWMKANSI